MLLFTLSLLNMVPVIVIEGMVTCTYLCYTKEYLDGLVQNCYNSIDNALELLLSYH